MKSFSPNCSPYCAPAPTARHLSLALALAAIVAGFASPLAATADSLRATVEALASPELEGRMTGSDGARRAAEHIVRELEAMGAEPLPGQEDMLLDFEFTAGTEDAGSALALKPAEGEPETFGAGKLRALSFSDNGEISAPLVFAGYGLVVPEGQDFGYDSYVGLDVADKVVLVLRYFPEDVDQETRGLLARYSGLRYKAMQARERGAKALLVVTGPRSPNAGELVSMASDTAISGSGILAASLGGEVGERLFAYVEGKTLEEAQKALDDGNPHVTGFEIPGVEIGLEVKVEREKRTGHNVVAMLPATVSELPAKPWVVVGAHYDHLGRGDGGNSLARKGETGLVHHGADDNASGVAAVLAVGRELTGRERSRHVALAFWSGEELGLLGSTDFLKDRDVEPEAIAAYVNFDMVGRARDNRLTLQAVGTSTIWPKLVERANVPVGFDLQTQEDPYLPTDSSAFHQASIPTLNFFTGSHEDYHRPSDTAATLDYEELERVAGLGARITAALADLTDSPDFVQVARKAQRGGDRDTVRAFTGTIPDYSTEVDGLLLSGVIEGGPADEGGLRKGDVIVEFAGQRITNIYDYTYALDAVKIGVPVQVVFVRDGERSEVTITPRARD